ncbi:MAG: polysaccharide deacetylase family protein [Pseudomonadota bacterium]
MRNRLLVLTFHRVLPEADAFRRGDITAQTFDRICACLTRFFRVMTLGDAAHRMRERGTLPDRALTLTFDDGFADNAELAAPILERHGLRATFFVSTGFLDGEIMFNDAIIEALRTARRDKLDLSQLDSDLSGVRQLDSLQARVAASNELAGALKYRQPAERLALTRRLASLVDADDAPSLMMVPDQVAKMAERGLEIGGHTVNHPILSELSSEAALEEIRAGRERLQAITQQRIDSFAYPNGRPGQDYDESTVDAVEAAGFTQAVTTAWGIARCDDDPLQLPRVTCWDRRAVTFVPRMLSYYLRGVRATQLPRESIAVA